MIDHFYLSESLCGEALKITTYILNSVHIKIIVKYVSQLKYGHKKMDLRKAAAILLDTMKDKDFINFMIPWTSPFWDEKCQILEDIELEGKYKIENIVFEDEYI